MSKIQYNRWLQRMRLSDVLGFRRRGELDKCYTTSKTTIHTLRNVGQYKRFNFCDEHLNFDCIWRLAVNPVYDCLPQTKQL